MVPMRDRPQKHRQPHRRQPQRDIRRPEEEYKRRPRIREIIVRYTRADRQPFVTRRQLQVVFPPPPSPRTVSTHKWKERTGSWNSSFRIHTPFRSGTRPHLRYIRLKYAEGKTREALLIAKRRGVRTRGLEAVFWCVEFL